MTQPKVILVLGAGATIGGGFEIQRDGRTFKPPTDRYFFDSEVVKDIFPPGISTDRFPVLSHYRQGKELETLWAYVDLYHKLCRGGIISEESTFFNLADKINKRAANDRAYRAKMEQESRIWVVPSMGGWEMLDLVKGIFTGLRHSEPTESPLYKLGKRLKDEDLLGGVITFNYDMSLEILFLDRFYYPLLPGQSISGRLPLLKLHGSLNWQFDTASDPPIFGMRDLTQVADTDYQNQSRYKQPEIIGPTFFKQEINVDTQLDPRGHFYKRLWAVAWDILRSADRLIFVGFSIPPTDFHAAALFRTAHLSGRGFRRVVLCHYHDKCLRGTAEQVFATNSPEISEFAEGLENMAEHLDEVIGFLRS